MYYVYILGCNDKRTYIGSTKDLKDRLKRHQSGYVPATVQRLPVELLSYFAFSTESTASNFEHYLKTGSGRAFLKKRDIIQSENIK